MDFLQVQLLLRFFPGERKEPYDLAMIRWFEIVLEEFEVYGCPQLYQTDEYNIIPISSIDQEVHIVQRFDKKIVFIN